MTAGWVSDTISLRVVEEIADSTGTDPFDVEPPLFHVIDPEALDRLFRPDADCRVSFEYNEHAVEVRSDGTVSVEPLASDELPQQDDDVH